jgi:hypothetical protein
VEKMGGGGGAKSDNEKALSFNIGFFLLDSFKYILQNVQLLMMEIYHEN